MLVQYANNNFNVQGYLMHSMCALLGCKKTRTTLYWPKSDGIVEQFNQTCLMMQSMFVNDRWDSLDNQLTFAMCAYRTRVYKSTPTIAAEILSLPP